MEREFLEKLGIEKDAIDKVMSEYGKVKGALVAAEKERDGLKAQIEDITKQIEAFKSVDVDGMKAEIESLKGDIAQKEENFQAELADRDFQAELVEAVAEAKGKNAKAITALLDIDALKGSRNQKGDIAAALAALKASDAYLFEDVAADKNNTTATLSTGGAHSENGAGTPNPWKKGDGYSLRKQTEMYRNDPALARQMAAEAGIRL